MADGSMDFSEQSLKQAQRTPKGRAYENWIDGLRHRMRGDKNFAAKRHASANEIRAVSPSSVHSDKFMSNLSVQYVNDEYIGEQLMPVVPVVSRSDKFATYSKRNRTAMPTDVVSGKSQVNEISEARGSDNYSVTDYALQDWVEATTIEAQDSPFDELLDITDAVNEGLALLREIRIATVLTTAANFGSNTTTLAGADQWNSGAGGNPIKAIQDGVASCWQGKGPGDLIGYCSLDVWNTLSRHQQCADLFKYTMPGLTKMDKLAQELGLAKILVGAARQDTANVGQSSATYTRIWGNHFGIVRVARRPTLRNAAFGYTLRMQNDPTTMQWFDKSAGAKGAYFSKVAVSEQHKICAADTGYLIVNATA